MDKNFVNSRTTKQKGPLLKIVLIGDSDVGKSTIISTFLNDSAPKEKFKKSVGIDSVLKYCEIKNKSWDTAGNEKLRTMISTYYRGAHAVIIVYDYTNINSFYSLKNWLREMKQFAPDNCVKYLVCNKIDKISPNTTDISTHWMINDEEVEKFSKINLLKFVKLSAINNTGIKELFESVGEDILSTTDSDTLKIRTESFKIGFVNGDFFNNGNSNSQNNKDGQQDRPQCCYKFI